MCQKITTKVCIVGAGPAGATASVMLGKMNIPHVLADASSFPRDKICGDGLDLKVVRVLNQIDPLIVQDELSNTNNFLPSMGMRFILPNRKEVDLICSKNGKDELLNKPIFYISRRTYFDNFLLEKTDKNFADLQLGVRIENIIRKKDCWYLYGKKGTAEIEICANMLIGADGDHSTVVKHVGENKINRTHYAAAIRQYWQGIQGLHPQNLIEIYFPAQYPFAYFWIFPLTNNQANVGFGMASHYVAKTKLNIKNALARIIKTDDYIAQRFKNAQPLDIPKGWGIPMSTLHRKAHGDGWLLTGDAASLVCPNSGEGIGPAMLSGYIAAHYAQRAVNHHSFTEQMFHGYDHELHKRFQQEERLYRLANALPGFLFTKAVNTVLAGNLFKQWFTQKEMKRWLITAYQKPIDIKLNKVSK